MNVHIGNLSKKIAKRCRMNNVLFNALPDTEKAKLLRSDGHYFQTMAEEFADAWMKAYHEIFGTEVEEENKNE